MQLSQASRLDAPAPARRSILLGGAIIWTTRAVIPTTLHVATGAAILAAALVLALRCQRRAWACRTAPGARGARLAPVESPA